MAVLADGASWVLLLIGSAMLVVGAVGMVRLPDVFARMHGAGIIETLGAGAVVAGLSVQAGLTGTTIKLVLILVFILFTSPTATHALARAALNGGVRPEVAADDEAVGEVGDAGDAVPGPETAGEIPSKT